MHTQHPATEFVTCMPTLNRLFLNRLGSEDKPQLFVICGNIESKPFQHSPTPQTLGMHVAYFNSPVMDRAAHDADQEIQQDMQQDLFDLRWRSSQEQHLAHSTNPAGDNCNPPGQRYQEQNVYNHNTASDSNVEPLPLHPQQPPTSDCRKSASTDRSQTEAEKVADRRRRNRIASTRSYHNRKARQVFLEDTFKAKRARASALHVRHRELLEEYEELREAALRLHSKQMAEGGHDK
jgi:hypothetical protein